jgi:hypothetical protein
VNKKLVISVVVLAALVLTIGAGAALATRVSAAGITRLAGRVSNMQDGAPWGDPSDLQGPGGPGFPGMPGGKGGRGGDMGPGRDDTQRDQDLADALGITVDELTAARSKAEQAMLAEGVKQGLITQAQADEASQTNTTGRPVGGRWLGYLQQKGLDFQTFMADALGISVEDLQAAQVKAQNSAIDRAVEAGNLTQEQADLMKARAALAADATFRTSLQTAYETAIKEAVSNGVITQAQADLILAQPQGGPGGPGGPGGFGPGFGPGGHH